MPTRPHAGGAFRRRAMPPSALPMAATPCPYRCTRWAATTCPASVFVCRRPRRPRPARGQQPHVDGASPLRARAARAAAADIRRRILRARCTRRRTHTRTPWRPRVSYAPRDAFGELRFTLHVFNSTIQFKMPLCPCPVFPLLRFRRWINANVLLRRQRLFFAVPCPRRLCPWGPPRHTPTGAPGGLPRHAFAGALVFRRPRRRRTRPARGQQPHANGAGPQRARVARAVTARAPSAWRIPRALHSEVAPHEDLVTTTISFVRRGAFR